MRLKFRPLKYIHKAINQIVAKIEEKKNTHKKTKGYDLPFEELSLDMVNVWCLLTLDCPAIFDHTTCYTNVRSICITFSHGVGSLIKLVGQVVLPLVEMGQAERTYLCKVLGNQVFD